MKRMIYAGIGSRRRTPAFIHDMMTASARRLEQMGYILRSGGAEGADKAFEAGVIYPDHKEIYRPKHATPQAIEIASEYHGHWDNCDSYTRKLHGRNVFIILGPNFDTPVDFVICYTPDGKDSGGTGLGIRISHDANIPVFNLYFPEVQERIMKFLGIKPEVHDLL